VLPLQVAGNFGELGESRLQVFDDLLSDDVGIGEVRAVFEAFVLKPEDLKASAGSNILLLLFCFDFPCEAL